MKKTIFTLAFGAALAVQAEEQRVTQFYITQPVSALAPLRTDTSDVMGQAWDDSRTLLANVRDLKAWKRGTLTQDSVLAAPTRDAVRLIGFTLQNQDYAQVNILVESIGQHEVSVDGVPGTSHPLTPGRHEVSIKLLQQADKADTLRISIDSKQQVIVNPTGKRPYDWTTLMYGCRLSRTTVSADGRFVTLVEYTTSFDNNTNYETWLVDLKTNQRRVLQDKFEQWASAGHSYITSQTMVDGSVTYYLTDALTGKRSTLCTNASGERGYFLPGERLMLINKTTEGPQKEQGVYQILEPDDRIPGWRNRNNILLLDTRTGVLRTITEGQHNVYASPSPDNSRLLLSVFENKITERPFRFMSALVLDLETMKADTLFTHDGFVNGGRWSPDGQSIVFNGSPEAFQGIGNRVPKGMTPSMIEEELYLMNLNTKEVKPLTADFNPNIKDWKWSKADGMIYALTENRDNQDIFQINPKTGTIKMLRLSERYIFGFDLADQSRTLVYYGQSHSNSDRAYAVNLQNGRETILEDLNATRMADIELGEFGEWNFRAERGDTIHGRYYLPPHFDPNKKYPMLVYYYGGCSPVGRYLDSYYSFHGWAAMGYVVYVIQPSGCTGFGQEFSARHVNAYGNFTADDIIQGTKQFCKEHPFVNPDKIGCLGASYGGFMTQYLQTQTDIFAAAMSHAGISDPSSYWGYGYWGYSYSTISAANSYPWNNPKLFNEHAPLNLADRIHTPLLFMHGTDDTNVPINESIQLFNALKILGRETAFVAIEGQGHHIQDYPKRILWQNTIYAWFQKWLKDDPTWWEQMYPTKTLK